LYATQFFTARKLKFILLLRPDDVISSFQAPEEDGSVQLGAIDAWRKLSETFQGSALFSYMVGKSVPDIFEYFGVDPSKDLPMIVAHNPSKDHKFKSKRLSGSKVNDATAFQEFVAGVLSGAISHVLKSEPVPRENKGHVLTAVGSTVVSIVSQQDKDVLLEVTLTH
jgi:hypothetical protein